jgi:hypothetical protein
MRDWAIAFGGLCITQLVQLLQRRQSGREWLAHKAVWLRWPVYVALVYGTLLWASPGRTQFIYFQF